MVPDAVVPVVAVALPNEANSVLHRANNENKEIKIFCCTTGCHDVYTLYNNISLSPYLIQGHLQVMQHGSQLHGFHLYLLVVSKIENTSLSSIMDYPGHPLTCCSNQPTSCA